MKARSILLYQFGGKAAILDVAESKYTLPVAVILVLCTAIARNYDQTYWRETWMFLFGPLIFSFFSGSFLSLVYFSSIRPEASGKLTIGRDYLSFMGLFWMTAPIAWLYALPAERWLDPMGAAQMNLTLLGTVSVWRVWLITRVLAVLTGGGMWPILVRVLIVAAIEIVLVTFVGGLFAAEKILSSMGGMRNSPDENLILSVLEKVFFCSLMAIPVFVIAAAFFTELSAKLTGFPAPTITRKPVVALAGIVLFWLLVAIRPQAELRGNATVENLVQSGEYRQAVEYLSLHSPEDFAPAKRIPPDPYDFKLYKDLPGLIGALDGNDAAWVRDLYMGYLDISFLHSSSQTFKLNDWATILKTLDHLPGGPEWISRNREELAKRLSVSESGSLTNTNPVANLEALREKYNIVEGKE